RSPVVGFHAPGQSEHPRAVNLSCPPHRFGFLPIERPQVRVFHTFPQPYQPITPRPTPSIPSTSTRLIRIRASRSNDDAVTLKMLLTVSNYHATMSCESQALSPSDDPIVSAPPLCP